MKHTDTMDTTKEFKAMEKGASGGSGMKDRNGVKEKSIGRGIELAKDIVK